MGFFNKFQETIRDKTRDNICDFLQSMGIDAQMAERGRGEENIESGSYSKSLGIIDITKGQIRWVNVVKRSEESPGGMKYYIKYGVPDSRLWVIISPNLEIKSARKKDNWQWKGKDAGLGLIHRLNSDISIGYTLLKSNSPKTTIRAYPNHNCWVISIEISDISVSEELWNSYQKIAQHLLVEWPTNHKLKIESPISVEPPTGDKVYDVCPRCGSANLNKAVGRMPKSQQEIDTLGFKTEWDCLCFNCRFEWVEREKP